MKLKEHIGYSLPIGAGIFFWFDTAALYFMVGAVLLDVDHIFEYWSKTKDINIKRMFEFYDRIAVVFRNRYYLGLSVFHTMEFLIIAIWMSFHTNNGKFLLAGILFHHLLDFIHLQRIHCLSKRSYSLIYYFYVSNLKESNDFKKMCKKEKEIFENILNK